MKKYSFCFLLAAFCTVGLSSFPSQAESLKEAEAKRIAVINKVKPAVVSIFGLQGWGGGSGVLIDQEGYALTNAHVVQPTGPAMRCGLSDGVLYQAVLVGIDKVGDVALIKLLPKKPGDKFPFAPLGDSDKVKPGDWSLAMGNPFVLATDFNPTVTFGLISGVNRYQHPSGGFLEYTDCIQTDTSINPGNSGGPLFNMNGEVVGINGRIMFAMEKRVRINSGHGYAISINQIKNFLGHFYAGIETDHATLGARIETTSDETDLDQITVKEVLDESDAHRRGLAENDVLLSFAGRPVTTVNQYKNILGIFPSEWRVPMTIRRGNENKEMLVRLMGYQPKVVNEPKEGTPQPKGPMPQGPKPPAEVQKLLKERKGYANYYFNEVSRDRLLEAIKAHGDFSKLTGNWTINGFADREGRASDFKASVSDVVDPKDKQVKTVVKAALNTDYTLEPIKLGQTDVDRMEPPGSGGLMMALYHYRRFLTLGPKGFEGESFTHGGYEPFYLMPADGSKPKSLADTRLLCEVIRTEHADVRGKWYFYRTHLNPNLPPGKMTYPDYALVGFEIYISKDLDPCEISLYDYKKIDGRLLPGRMDVRFGDRKYATLNNLTYTLAEASK
ncbi:trypsin-like peptidase domain-containing protein [Telmatocola sphagniphila]|uniref:Trypsin-like peptidase domain-containing protein n=1 Tax=Telmatocola sphagniphila TaxID=1123043 RepID=A0A8E6EVA8_9BACT|nr:trypsin-like peptidase domain-containing protein [Telmatocola sphagniphila]QVL34714.1 trypsin-like peptidase domain-containing protein [Telmatocola sphagniphila]